MVNFLKRLVHKNQQKEKKNGNVYSEPLTQARSQNMRQEGQYSVNPSKMTLIYDFWPLETQKSHHM